MNLWNQLKRHTTARIGLDYIGHSISTHDLIDFQLAHAEAKDSVYQIWDFNLMQKKLQKIGDHSLVVHTMTNNREEYLKKPDLGRNLNTTSLEELKKYAKKTKTDVALIITDGLSTKAVDAHALSLYKSLKKDLLDYFPDLKMTLVLVPFGRVALSDDIGNALNAKMSIMFVGERPGLSSVDSLGIYLTYDPKLGNTDANRNCISNIHPPNGLDYATAAQKLLALMQESFRLKISGVSLKEYDPPSLTIK